VKAGIGKEKAALLVVIGVKEDGTKQFLALEAGYRESKESWAGVLRDLKRRGVKTVGYLSAMETWGYGRRWERFIRKLRSSFAGITRCST
jgi:transposase-like protein